MIWIGASTRLCDALGAVKVLTHRLWVHKRRGRLYGEWSKGAENVGELETLFSAEANGHRIGLDLKDRSFVDQDAVICLELSEIDNIELKNCPAYVCEWITRQRLALKQGPGM